MNKLLLISITALFLSECSGSPRQNDSIKYPVNDLSKFVLIHTFISKDGQTLGSLYGIRADGETFSDFVITHKLSKKVLPIYVVSKTSFMNTKGVENVLMEEHGFYGYSIINRSKVRLTLEPIWRQDGKLIKSDSITIVWDEDEKVFKVLLTP